MRFIKLTIAYEGTAYVGWQVQPNGPSIQAALESAWNRITGERRRITASGRTDSGVHARGQVCSLRTVSRLETDVLQRALNAMLPEDICVVRCEEMPEDFHAIRDAVEKTYCYQIQTGPIRDVLRRHLWWYVPPRLDLLAMRQAANLLIGRHDFASFQTAGSDRKTTVRTISRLEVESSGEDDAMLVRIIVAADGFLYNMVRCIAGTLTVVGKKKESPEWVLQVLKSCDRTTAGPTAPPQGLFLESVRYPEKFMGREQGP